MKERVKNLPPKVKQQMQTALILLCAVITFIVPAFGGGYSILQAEPVTSSAAAIEDIDLLLVAASAFGEARKVMNATDPDAKDQFINNLNTIVTPSKWHNVGLIVGARDSLSGSTWSTYQNPVTLSNTEVQTYGGGGLAEAYNKYKAFGYAVQNLNNNAQKSATTAVSVEEGLDAMSAAAIKLGSFGVEFLNEYNPGPVLLALYDSRYLATYSANKLVQIVIHNEVLLNIVTLFGDTVPGTGVSFFIILNGVIAIVGFAISMFLTLLGNRTIGDNVRKLLVRVVIGTVGIYLISNIMAKSLEWLTATMQNVTNSTASNYVEENLNVYDWYLTGFQLPAGTTLQIDANGNFIFTPDIIRAINEYTYGRLVGGGGDEAIQQRMVTYTQNGNKGTASFITPSESGGEGEAWATDVYYAIMNNFAQNKELTDGNDDESSPLYGKTSVSVYSSRYMWMSSLSISGNGDGWSVTGNGSSSYYGLNPISAFNLVRSDFSGEAISSTQTVYPAIAYVAFDAINNYATSADTHMNSITRFIACFTLVLAAFKGLITIFTAGFGGLISGGMKTAFGSSHGLGQALGAVVAIVFGTIGISVIMSMTLSLLDIVYGIAVNLVGNTEVISAFIQPLQEALSGIPVIGTLLVKAANGIAGAIMTLIMALTFPKLGGIPITMFAQMMADLPGHLAERAQMIENMLMSGRSSAGGGLPPRGGQGQYGKAAQQMAGSAFARSTRQAGAIFGAGAAAAGSLAGASLSAAGKALNKKGDAVEGKPQNPGIAGWDDMTPEQQAKAAEAANNIEGWNEMDQDARQKALEEAGVFEENAAQGGTPGVEDIQGGEDSSVSETSSGSDYTETVEEVSAGEGYDASGETIDQEGAPIHEVGPEMSMNEGAGETVSGDASGFASAESGSGAETSGNVSGAEMHGNSGNVSEATVPGDVSEKSVSADGKDGASVGTIGTAGNTIQSSSSQENISKAGDHVQGGNQTLNTKVEQENKADVKNVDASRQLNKEDSHDLENNSLDGRSTNSTSATNMSGGITGLGANRSLGGQQTAEAQAAAAAGQSGTSGRGLPNTTGTGRSSSSAQQSGASATYKSVNQMSQTAGNQNLNVNSDTSRNTQFNAGADQSRTLNTSGKDTQQGKAGQEMPNAQSLDQGTPKDARKAADGGATSQSMNGTVKSRYGKEMTIEEQKKARLLHAAGDALQMAGGNRSMKDGVSEALGHAKDAAIIYSLPEELQQNDFMTSLRTRRIEREQRRNRREKK